MRLFDEKGNYNEVGLIVDMRAHVHLRALIGTHMREHPETDVRDLTLVVLNAAAGVTNEFILERKR